MPFTPSCTSSDISLPEVSACVSQFIDFAFILLKDYDSIDQEILKQNLKKLGRESAWKMIGCVLVDILGYPKEKYPYYSADHKAKADIIFRIILDEGNFGEKKMKGDAKVDTYLQRKWKSLKGKASHWKRLYQISPILFLEVFCNNIFVAMKFIFR